MFSWSCQDCSFDHKTYASVCQMCSCPNTASSKLTKQKPAAVNNKEAVGSSATKKHKKLRKTTVSQSQRHEQGQNTHEHTPRSCSGRSPTPAAVAWLTERRQKRKVSLLKAPMRIPRKSLVKEKPSAHDRANVCTDIVVRASETSVPETMRPEVLGKKRPAEEAGTRHDGRSDGSDDDVAELYSEFSTPKKQITTEHQSQANAVTPDKQATPERQAPAYVAIESASITYVGISTGTKKRAESHRNEMKRNPYTYREEIKSQEDSPSDNKKTCRSHEHYMEFRDQISFRGGTVLVKYCTREFGNHRSEPETCDWLHEERSEEADSRKEESGTADLMCRAAEFVRKHGTGSPEKNPRRVVPEYPGQVYVKSFPLHGDDVVVAFVEVTKAFDWDNMPRGMFVVEGKHEGLYNTSHYVLKTDDPTCENHDIFLEAAARACEACRKLKK